MRGKLLGAALLLAAALWTVITRLRQQRRQIVMLDDLATALEAMASAIRWQKRPLPEIIADMTHYSLVGEYFRNIADEVECEIPLQIAWNNVFSTFPIERERVLKLKLSGDAERLTGELQYVAEQLKECSERYRSHRQQTERLWMAGTLSGVGMLIILLI